VTVISHSVLTNHRIVAQAEEPFPDAGFHMTTSQLPDLVHLSANPSRQQTPSQLVLLQAYAQVVLGHPEYRTRYWSLAQQLKSTHADNIYILEALADEAVQKHTAEGSSRAITYLQNAIQHGATNPSDFEELAELLISAEKKVEAIDVLLQAIQLVPYEAKLYELTAKIYFDRQQTQNACEVVAKGSQRCPQDDALRGLLQQCSRTPSE
jgi:predicted Zn-dependent protease